MNPIEVLDLVTELLAATADAHTPRALVRAIAATLATRMAITRVELPIAIAEYAGGDWQWLEAGTPARDVRELAPGLAVRGTIPRAYATAEARGALGQVIAAALRHLEVIQRLAKVSREAHVENRALRARLERHVEVVARSSAMRAAMTRVEQVARHPTSVLLAGESGTGKEVLARELHRLSARAHQPLILINCGAIPESLVESELFGHERGAFTGATRTHAGVFERAHRGTLVLDEVGELPLAAQVKLLRVLQERRLRRVGGEAVIEVDVRLIAATNRSLATMVEQGTFREDLYYRLDVFAIRVPPLRERRGDLGPLVANLVAEHAQRLGMTPPPIPRTLLARLEAHDWPGNVRELANVLETALILGDGETLELPAGFATRSQRDTSSFDTAVGATIEAALRRTRGKIYGTGGAAELLGLKPGTLQSKMRKLGIERSAFVPR